MSAIITNWFILPSTRISGGILLGINDDKIEILNSWILTFSITILIKNKTSGFIWMYTTVYGPTIANQRDNFWTELKHIRNLTNEHGL